MAPVVDADLRVGVGAMLGTSTEMKAIWDLLERLAAADVDVLVSGETGTGKDLFVRTLHARSRRRDGPLVVVDCSARAGTLLEDDLFGHESGAFTGAVARRIGCFEAAGGGTILLNEIGELPVELQTKLLGAIGERRVQRLGNTREIAVDVRVVAATNADVAAGLRTGRFREDLYYRLAVVHVKMPPLRRRGDDVLLLAQHFTSEFAAAAGRANLRLSPGAYPALLGHDWPGNVRELRNCIHAAVALARSERIEAADLRFGGEARGAPGRATSEGASLEVERRNHDFVAAVLAAGGNRSATARKEGIDRRTVQRRLKRLGLADLPRKPDRE
ncbi:MAG: sigma-54-dependent Fis family transcriptional regulator [Deltaproteobacteria bacterium]|nr:sigma-54-dependent Fis family transcriptional regulator [Deltaproteobacteria bacterium]